MAKEKYRGFRIAKEELIKAISRRPKAFFRPSKVHKSKKIYDRQKGKQSLKKALKETND